MNKTIDESLLQRYIEDKATLSERDTVVNWILKDKKNHELFLEKRRMYDAILINTPTSFAAESQKKFKPQSFVYKSLRIAALFLLLLGLSHLIIQFKQDDPLIQTIYAPVGQHVQISLADGTEVWLNSNSKLSFPTHFTQKTRKVVLEGEGYFKVTHDKKRKFIVQTEKYNVKVLGTEFNVKAYSKDNVFETALIDGRVEVSSIDEEYKIQLLKNQKIYLKDEDLVLASINNYNSYLWKEGIIAFESKNIKDIFRELELFYDVSIRVTDTDNTLMNASFSGKFRTKDGVDHILRVLQCSIDFSYTVDSESNLVSVF